MNGELLLSGLDCANCAAKIERRVAELNGVQSARLDFMTGRLVVTASEGADIGALLRSAADTARTIEPDIEIKSPEQANTDEAPRTMRLFTLVRLVIGTLLFFAGILASGTAASLPRYIPLVAFIASYLIIGGGVLLKALRNILHGQIFDENFLMSIASIGAFCIGEYAEGVAVMLLYNIGEMFEDMAVRRSRRSIEALMDIRPDAATVIRDGGALTVSPESVAIGETILIKPGERVPLDGIVISGSSSLDTAALTGESAPRDVGPGSEVLSGSVNINGALTVSVTKPFGESTVSKILELVRDAGSRKAPAESFITRFARYYTPIVVAFAVLLAVIPPLVLPGAVFADWLRRALVFLVVSCPCALVISVPLGYFGGIGAASRRGVLVKGGASLDALADVHTVVFDKTGTLTAGEFSVSKIVSRSALTERELLEVAAAALKLSNHPVAFSIVKAAGDASLSAPDEFEELAGLGVSAAVDGKRILAGNTRLMATAGIADTVSVGGTAVHIAIDGEYAGCVTLEDTLRAYSRDAVGDLRASGVSRLVMLTGDAKAPAQRVSDALGLDGFYSGLLPHQKVERLEELLGDVPRGKLMFVGDGINDAPVLRRADIGVAMGGAGSDAAIEASDVVIMTDDTRRIADAVHIARRTRTIVRQNIVFALGVKLIIMILASFGVATMWEAVFGDVGVSLLAVANSLRALRYRRG